MTRIFLSYAREDRATAEKLARFLGEHDLDVWWDRHIVGGEEFAAEIEEELKRSSAVVVLWSKHSIKSRWVRDEAAAGSDAGRLVPISIDGALPPMGFRQFHTLDLKGWKPGANDAQGGALVEAIERRTGTQDRSGRLPAPTIRHRSAPRFPMIAGALLALLAVIGGIYFVTAQDQSSKAGSPTIALLPITATAGTPETRALASQTSDALVHSLSQSNFVVRQIPEAPANLKDQADYLLTGEISRSEDKTIATVRIEEAEHRAALFTRRIEAVGADVANLPERVGAQIAGTLNWAAPLMALEKRNPSDPATLAALLRQLDITGDLLNHYQIARQAVARSPKSAFAQISLALDTAFVLEALPRGERKAAVAAARAAADRGMKLAPEFGDTYGAWCYLHSEVRRLECEDRLLTGKRADPEAPFLNHFHSAFLSEAGRFREAYDLARLSLSHDHYTPMKIAMMIHRLEFAGESSEARSLTEKNSIWWPETEALIFWERWQGLLERGDLDALSRLETEAKSNILPPHYSETAPLAAAVKARSLTRIHAICGPNPAELLQQLRCLVASIQVGDGNGAYTLMDAIYRPRIGSSAADTERIWLDDPRRRRPDILSAPFAAAIRSDARFIPLVRRIGLLDYWRSGRLPDFCVQQREAVCAKLR
jgi:TolB-like protein